MPNSLKSRLKKLKHQGLLSEKDLSRLYTDNDVITELEKIKAKIHGRKFEGIVVEYPPAELCTYPEYRDKPYFSIKYEENGEHIIGYGTYNPDVLSRYLREYFITPIIEADKGENK